MVLFEVVDDMLGLEAGGAGLRNGSDASDGDVTDEPAMLGFRIGALEGAYEVPAATDWRLLMVGARGAGFGATTLEGRGRVAAAAGLGFGVAALGVDGGTTGAGWETIRSMLESFTNKP